MGVGVDDGVLIARVPVCPGGKVERVVFTPALDSGYDPVEANWWIAENYSGENASTVRLEAMLWQTASGVEPSMNRPFSIDIWIDGDRFGTVIYRDELATLADIGGGYLVEGEVVNEAEFDRSLQPQNCAERPAL